MNLKKQLIKRLNLSKILWPSLANGLYCFNFHRIGNWEHTLFDPCVFSCDEDNFKSYLIFLKNNFRIITQEELNQIIDNNTPITEKLALITFDDGYADNYHVAYPLLKSLNLPATFFITTNLVGSTHIPWWDEIAWHVNHCEGKTIQLSNWQQAIEIDVPANKDNIRKILQQIKVTPNKIESQLQELREISKEPIPDNSKESIFVTWQQLLEMSENNMTIGAHSHTHKIFSCLTESELSFELKESKRLIETNLAISVKSLSYPIGSVTTYSRSMFDTISDNGYKLAFSFSGVINNKPHENRFELGRFSIDQPFNERELMEMILGANKAPLYKI
jgi:peptidoglycan/xylan/chitin deacetylase (PgdA/CDA1 family)